MNPSGNPSEATPRGRLLASAVVIVLGMLLFFFIIALMLWAISGAERREKEAARQGTDQQTPEEKLAALRARETRELSEYGWVDAEKRVVRLPVEAAMEKYLQEKP